MIDFRNALKSRLRPSHRMRNRFVASPSGRAIAPPPACAPGPSTLEWLVAVFGAIVQQAAFVSVPLMMSGDTYWEAVGDPLNAVAVSISLASLGLVFVKQIRPAASLAVRNLPSILFLVVVLLSSAWSIHPDVSIRRGIGYVLTMALAVYLVVRFNANDRMKVLSWSFIVSAVGSLLFVAMFPQYGIMHAGALAGEWRGVFPHKNVLGPIMSVAVFIELYLLVNGNGRPRWRFASLAAFASLVVFSHSATAWLVSTLYAAGACIYLIWRRQRLAGATALLTCLVAVLAGAIVVWSDPEAALTAIGRDATFTGRTTVWDVTLTFIRERPLLGWGYRAMWEPYDPTTVFADRLTGHWGVPSAHNAFLEITLQLGLVGMSVMLLILCVAFWRAMRCCLAGIAPIGWFSLLYFLGTILAAQTEVTLGQNQVVAWLVFNVLAFSCGLELAASGQVRLAHGVGGRFVRQTRTRRNRPAAGLERSD